MENVNEVKIKQDNVTIVELDNRERKRIIGELISSDSVSTPVFINITQESDEDFYGDVQIIECEDELSSKKYYNVNITAITFDDNVMYLEAVKIGIREMLNKFKSDKVNVDCIYLLHSLDVPSYYMVQMGLSIQEILVMNKLTNKVRLWIENIDNPVCDNEEDVCCTESKPKKKKKKDKDKKKKKKGKKK